MTKNEPDECGKDGLRESGSQFASATFHLFARAPTDHLAGRIFELSAVDVEAIFVFCENDREIRLAVLKLMKQGQRYLVVRPVDSQWSMRIRKLAHHRLLRQDWHHEQ